MKTKQLVNRKTRLTEKQGRRKALNEDTRNWEKESVLPRNKTTENGRRKRDVNRELEGEKKHREGRKTKGKK